MRELALNLEIDAVVAGAVGVGDEEGLRPLRIEAHGSEIAFGAVAGEAVDVVADVELAADVAGVVERENAVAEQLALYADEPLFGVGRLQVRLHAANGDARP